MDFVGGAVIALHNIKIEGGKVTVDTSKVSDNGWNDGLYACGSIEISGGTIDINASRIGLFVPGTGAVNPTTGLKITGGNVYFFGSMSGIYTGLDNPKDVYINTTGTVDSKSSPIGIYVYDGNLNILNGKFKYEKGKPFYKMGSNNITGVVNIKEADYTKVNNEISKIPADLSKYTEASVKDLETAKQAVINENNILEQDIVDEYATEIEKAIKALKYKDADYTKVDEAIAKIPSQLKIYTFETVEALKKAVDSVVRNKDITQQKEVDLYAEKIEEAIKGLEKIQNTNNTENTNTETAETKETETKEKDEKNSNNENNNTNTSKNINSDIVETGDEVVLISIIFVSAIIGVVVAFRAKM